MKPANFAQCTQCGPDPLRRRRRGTAERSKAAVRICDGQIRESLEGAQLKLQRERGTDLTIFSPRASSMAQHMGDAPTRRVWP